MKIYVHDVDVKNLYDFCLSPHRYCYQILRAINCMCPGVQFVEDPFDCDLLISPHHLYIESSARVKYFFSNEVVRETTPDWFDRYFYSVFRKQENNLIPNIAWLPFPLDGHRKLPKQKDSMVYHSLEQPETFEYALRLSFVEIQRAIPELQLTVIKGADYLSTLNVVCQSEYFISTYTIALGQSKSTLEAIAQKTFVIASDPYSILSQIYGGVTLPYQMHQVSTPAGLEEKLEPDRYIMYIQQLRRSPDTVKYMCDRAYAYVMRHHSFESIINRFVSFLKQDGLL